MLPPADVVGAAAAGGPGGDFGGGGGGLAGGLFADRFASGGGGNGGWQQMAASGGGGGLGLGDDLGGLGSLGLTGTEWQTIRLMIWFFLFCHFENSDLSYPYCS